MKVRSISTLGDYLREQRRNAELSLRQLADLAGVSNPYLSQIERGVRKPSAEVLQQLAKALRVSAEVLYVRAGLLDPSEEEGQEDRSVEMAIRADPALSVRQKRVLLDIYSSFRREAHEEEISEPLRESTTRNRAARRARQED
ncbi:helix-turn-helix domain-containing protein [Actinopolymorpha alba]|uniref:helix-turn-helix domain-containing protein n=1 Tax=Actinopolymorpha alba TaxID=533267 RepID=UPI00037F3304|nr:helix-turn-helix transcriptional regulator [Actinopolymorpha alba]